MEPVRVIQGRLLPLDRRDVDTDQIMPRQFLNRVERTGFGEFVFNEWRRDPSFALNDARFAGATILVAGPNFGSGSSREQAVWGLQQYGFRAVLAPSFSDIFVGNCAQVGLVAACLPEDPCRRLIAAAESDPSAEATVDVAARVLEYRGERLPFQIKEEVRTVLLSGLDDISLILAQLDSIERHERDRPRWLA
jgi:3-isopropylmalate/(R)-2-methylmalate dehydratase small subunit